MKHLLKGSEVVEAIKQRLTAEVARLKQAGVEPCLGIVRLGARPDDLAYERGAVKRCEGLGIQSRIFEYPEILGQAEFLEEIGKINRDAAVHGILIFRPLPGQIDENAIKMAIAPEKDVDCLHPANVAKVFEGDETGFAPCTPAAVMELLEHFGVDVKGKRVVVIGRSLVVGKPLAMLLLKKHATVTLCHTRTVDLAGTCRNAEILIAAAGKAKMVTKDFVSPGQTVIDVGINMDENGALCGDVDFEEVSGIVDAITPVPGGIGPITTSVLAAHVVRAAGKSAGR